MTASSPEQGYRQQQPSNRTECAFQPHLASYDSGYEFSVEHALDVRRLVENAEA